jgi:hypothetical protein
MTLAPGTKRLIMTIITLEELARACCVAIGGGIAGQLVVALPGSAIWLLPAGAAVAGCALTVPEIRAEVANTLPLLAAAGQRARHVLPGGLRRALPASQEEAAPPTPSSAATHPANAAAPPSISATKGEELIPALESTPHRLIIGHTRGGKTTLVHHLATSWARQGERVLVADPDAAPGLWPGCTVTGHGDDLESITRMLEEVKVEVAARRKARAQGTRQFPPLHLVIDEAQDVLPAIEGGLELFEDIARRGGKLNIRMTVGVQDKQVRTLGLQGKSEVLRNLQVADVLKNREGQRMAVIRDAETGQKISLAIPDLPNPERLIRPVEPQTTPHAISTPAPAPTSSTEPDPLLAALLNTSVPSAAERPEADHAAAVTATRTSSDDGNSHTSVTVSPNHGSTIVKIIAQATAGRSGRERRWGRGLDMKQRRQRIAKQRQGATLRQAYAEARAAGVPSFRQAYKRIGGNSQEALAAWQAAAPPAKTTSVKK